MYPEEATMSNSNVASCGVAFAGLSEAAAEGVARGLEKLRLVEAAGFWSMSGWSCRLGARFVFGRWRSDEEAAGAFLLPEDCHLDLLRDSRRDMEWASAPFAASETHAASLRSRHSSDLSRLLVPRKPTLPVPLFAAKIVGQPSRVPFVISPVAVGPYAHPRTTEKSIGFFCTAPMDQRKNQRELGGLVSTFAFDLEAVQADPFHFYSKDDTGSATLRKESWFTLARAVDLATSSTPQRVAVFTPPRNLNSPPPATTDVSVCADVDALTPLLQRGCLNIFMVVEDPRTAIDLLNDLFETEPYRDVLSEQHDAAMSVHLVTKAKHDKGLPGGITVKLTLLHCCFDAVIDPDTLSATSAKASTRAWFNALPRRTRRHFLTSPETKRDALLANFVAWLIIRNKDFLETALGSTSPRPSAIHSRERPFSPENHEHPAPENTTR